jgi:hypothetical protein
MSWVISTTIEDGENFARVTRIIPAYGSEAPKSVIKTMVGATVMEKDCRPIRKKHQEHQTREEASGHHGIFASLPVVKLAGMQKISVEPPKAPIGFFKSLWKGVEAVNSHLWLLAIPIVLDIFLWFGPHISVAEVLAPFLQMVESAFRSTQGDPALFAPFREFLVHFNLFAILSNLPLFPPSIMASRIPVQTPLGLPVVLQVQDPLSGSLLLLALFLGSIALGSSYWLIAGRAVADRGWNLQSFAARWIRTVGVMLALFVLLGLLILAFSVFGLIIASVLGVVWLQGSIFITQLLVFGGIGLLFWVVLFMVFSPHGTILYQDGILRAMWNSLETSRWIYPLSMWVPILFLILNMIAVQIWALPAETEWVGLLSILGNAYTGSVLVVASLIYYQDKRRWIEQVRALIQSQKAASVPPLSTS